MDINQRRKLIDDVLEEKQRIEGEISALKSKLEKQTNESNGLSKAMDDKIEYIRFK